MVKNTEKTYSSTTAKIIANKGETMKADIMQTGEKYAEQLFAMRDNMRTAYWELHSEIAEHSFNGKHEQTAAIATLGKFALALEAVETAYSAANTVRCF